ncbi:MAG: peptide chain release factor 1 [Candidatus Dependentiae bacterium]|nr:peptide chain release factor 1 [Candidatus Dependentiae bacterium]
MAIKWDVLQKRYDELAQILTDHAVDHSKRHKLQKELSFLTGILAKNTDIVNLQKQIVQTESQAAATTDPEMAELFAEERAELQAKLNQEKVELENRMFPPSEHDNRSVFLEIRAGTGGQEAALFAGDLQRMYTNYALRKGWRVSVESSSSTDLGGVREVVLNIQGQKVYGHLKHESGVHRVQRVPLTETQGRVHTSTATVAVLPEAEEVDVSINPADLRIDVYRSGGAGGQHVNTTDSAVRITHIPTGTVVACQDERSQHKNKAKAMKLLQSRILAHHLEKSHQELSEQRKEQVGTGDRAEKVRTYNFPQNRVTDHQVDVTLKKLDMVMEGALDEIIDALVEKERETRRKEFVVPV